MAEITASTNEQSTSINEVGQALAQLDQMTQQNAALVEESTAASESLREQAHHLNSAVSLGLGYITELNRCLDSEDT